MHRTNLQRCGGWLLERLGQPSSAAGLAALLALLIPGLAEVAPVIVDLALNLIAIGAAVVAMVKGEAQGNGNGCACGHGRAGHDGE